MRSLLVVDDSKYIREYCRLELSHDGYQVEVARHALDAVARLAGRDISLLVLDVHLKDGNVSDLFRQIRQQFPDLPVIFFTSDAHRFRETPCDAASRCVFKTPDLDALREAIRQLLPHRGVQVAS